MIDEHSDMMSRRKGDGAPPVAEETATLTSGAPVKLSYPFQRFMLKLVSYFDRHSHHHALDALTYGALVDRLYANFFIPTLGPIFFCPMFLGYGLHADKPHVTFFAAFLFVMAALRYLSSMRYQSNRSRMRTVEDFGYWDGLFLLLGWLNAATIGLGSAVLFYEVEQSQTLVMALTICYTSLISVRNAGRGSTVIGQLLFCAIPVIVAPIMLGGYANYVMSIALSIYYSIYVKMSAALSAVQVQNALANRNLHIAAHTDALTGLPNRLDFEEKIEHLLQSSERFTLVMIDLDDFKQVNDSLGHDVGDGLINAVGQRLAGIMRRTDYIARVGGDEYIAILKGAMQDGMVQALNRMSQAFAEPFQVGEHLIRSGASIGAADTGAIGTKRDVIKAADIALYRSKARGKNCVSMFTPDMWAQKLRENTLHDELERSIAIGDVQMVYQPIVNIETGKVVSFEALMRWKSPTYGPVSPGEFIPLAEQSRLIVPLTYLSIHKTIEEAVKWPDDVKVAINLSAAVMYNVDELQQVIFNALMQHGLSPARLEFEITETTLISSLEQATKFITAMRAWQIRVNLDDFGAGYSSLAYIRTLEFSKVKVDKAFIDNIVEDHKSRAIVSAVNFLCSQINMSLVVEGVEYEEQAIIARQCGVHEAQGYFFARPMPDADVIGFLDQKKGQATGLKQIVA